MPDGEIYNEGSWKTFVLFLDRILYKNFDERILTLTMNVIRGKLEADAYLTTRDHSTELGVSQSAIVKQIKISVKRIDLSSFRKTTPNNILQAIHHKPS